MLHCVGLGRVKKLFGPSAATFCIIDFVIPSFNNRHFVSLCSEKSIRKKGIESEPNLVHLRYFRYSIKSNNLSLKYRKFTPSGCKDIGIRKFEFMPKTQFFCH